MKVCKNKVKKNVFKAKYFYNEQKTIQSSSNFYRVGETCV